jgi:hypothetical protein
LVFPKLIVLLATRFLGLLALVMEQYGHSIKYTDAEMFLRLILGDGVVRTLDKVY